jgi:hypothetical protein
MVFPQSTSLTSSQCDHGLQHLVTDRRLVYTLVCFSIEKLYELHIFSVYIQACFKLNQFQYCLQSEN